jgi:uncharacterized protein YjbI with pentapeptide repeats
MANKKDLLLITKGVAIWNSWRRMETRRADLSDADLSHMDLSDAYLTEADLTGANLNNSILIRSDLGDAKLAGADLVGAMLIDAYLVATDLRSVDVTGGSLVGARLSGADMRHAQLIGADLSRADLSWANLSNANLNGARLLYTNLTNADLTGANMVEAELHETIFANVKLTDALGLATCVHLGPSIVDQRTLEICNQLPLSFVRGIGVPEMLIEYLPSLMHRAIQYYSCFISYSTKDQEAANRLHADLQNKGVRCWFAPHDMRIGAKVLDEIDTAIRIRDKLLLILSEHSIASDWVETEVMAAFEEERNRGQTMLFPIRLDDAVIETSEPWAAKLRARHIGDFRRWKDYDAYKDSFERLIRDLRVPTAGALSSEEAG